MLNSLNMLIFTLMRISFSSLQILHTYENYMRANQRKVYNMDPLQPPLISKYEWEYKNDINQRMRVPDKLSVATSLPNLDSSKHHDSDCKDSGMSIITFSLH